MEQIFNIGYYITKNHIKKAIELLELQLEQKSPLYNTVDFTIYRNSNTSIDIASFYKRFIKPDTFYYFEDKFQILNYYGVQKAYKIREFHFFTWNMLVLYYAVGFYIRELLDKYIINFQNIYSKKPINIFYGGSINIENPKKSKIYYYDDYKEFLHIKETLTKPEKNRIKYAISLDIKSFFYSIDHKILLEIINKKAYPTTKKRLHFNENAKESIEFLFKYLVQGSKGIPVSNQNIISSFISSIYFTVFDEFIVDNYLNTGNFHYIRYVDDFYLIFTENASEPINKIRKKIYDIENEISDFLIENLKLSISSSKSNRFIINNSDTHLDFLNSTSFESPFVQEFDYNELYGDSILNKKIKDKPAPEIFNECIDILKKLKLETNSLSQIKINAKESTYLNNILIHKGCLAYSKSTDAKRIVSNSEIFSDFENIDFILIKIKVLLHLITINSDYRNKFFIFLIKALLSGKSITQTITIVDKFIHQLQFLISESQNDKKIELEKEYNEYINKFIEILEPMLKHTSNKYIQLIFKALNNEYKLFEFDRIYDSDFLSKKSSVPLVQQIKQRNINEKLGNFNVSFNHLLNEFQSLFEMLFLNGKQVSALEIRNKMTEKGFTTSEIKFITEFFDRRNQNSISHTNELEIGFWSVEQSEYENFKSKLIPIIRKIYNMKNDNA